MKYVLACILLIVCGYGKAQQKDPARFAASITADDLKKNLFNIASEEMEGRETATDGQKKAAAYIEYIFRANGLKEIWNGFYQQRFPVFQDSLERALNLSLDYKFNDPNDPERIFYRSDHYNFAKNGVPAVFYFNGLHKDYHRPTDTPDKINYELLAKRAQLIFYTAWEIANRDEMLKRDIF